MAAKETGPLTTGAKITFHQAFGLKGSLRDSLAYCSDKLIVYAVGRQVAVHDLHSNTMSFVQPSPDVEGILGIALSANRKYLALCERCTNSELGAQVTVVYLPTHKRLRTMNFSTEGDFVNAAFSADGKWLVTQSDYPEHVLVLWNWDKEKILGSIKLQSKVTRVSFTPTDAGVMIASGPKFLKSCKLGDGIKANNILVGKKELQNYVDHTWVEGLGCVVITKSDDKVNGDLFVLVDGEPRFPVTNIHPEGKAPETVCGWSEGFLVGCADSSVLIFKLLDSRKESENPFVFERAVTICSEPHTVVELHVSPSDEQVVGVLSNNQVLKWNLAEVEAGNETDTTFTDLTTGFHNGAINDMDVCMRKPLVFTCGIDRTIRGWNYLENSCDVVQAFDEEPNSIAVHPLGFQIIVALRSRLRMCNVLAEEIRPFWDFSVKDCRMVRFSPGGQYFAAAAASSLYIYSTYSFQQVLLLRGHMGHIRDVSWSADDQHLVSAGLDGGVYTWSLRTGERVDESVTKVCQYKGVVGNADCTRLVAGGTDKKLRELIKDTPPREIPVPFQISRIAISKNSRMVCVGSNTGVVRIYEFPISGFYNEYYVHESEITQMRISQDDNFLFTASEDGSLFVLNLVPIKDNVELSRTAIDRKGFLDVVAISKAEIGEKMNQIFELETKVEEQRSATEYKLHVKDQYWSDLMKRQTEEHERALAMERKRFDEAKMQAEQQMRELQEEMENLERTHKQTMQDAVTNYERRIREGQEALENLQESKELMAKSYEADIRKMEQKHKDSIKGLKEEFELQNDEQTKSYGELKQEYEFMEKAYEEYIGQQEGEYEKEVIILKEKLKTDVEKERQAAMIAKSELAIKQNMYDQSQRKLHEVEKQVQVKDEENAALEKQITVFKKNISSLSKDIREREDQIAEKEKKLIDLRQSNKRLENVKNMFGFRIIELEKEREPTEEQLESLKEQLKNLDSEFEKQLKMKEESDNLMKTKDMRIESLNNEIQRERDIKGEKERLIECFSRDLNMLVNETDPIDWDKGIKIMYRMYVKEQLDSNTDDASGEFQRQREYMERSLAFLKKVMLRTQSMRKTEVGRKMSENFNLLNEVNKLREERTKQEMNIKGLERQVTYLEQTVTKYEKMKRASAANSRARSVTPSDMGRSTLSSAETRDQGKYAKRLGGGMRVTPNTTVRTMTDPMRDGRTTAESAWNDFQPMASRSSAASPAFIQSLTPSPEMVSHPAAAQKEFVHIAKPMQALPSIAPPQAHRPKVQMDKRNRHASSNVISAGYDENTPEFEGTSNPVMGLPSVNIDGPDIDSEDEDTTALLDSLTKKMVAT